MKTLFVWGAGNIGGRIVSHINGNWDITFVDADEHLMGFDYYGRRVIGVREYIENHADEFILIAHLQEVESIELLQSRHITNYFVYSDLPGEFMEPCPRDDLKNYLLNYLGGREDFVLYGLNIYSMIIDDWLFEQYGVHPYILVQEDADTALTDKIRQKYADLRIVSSLACLHHIKEICGCMFDDKKGREETELSAYKWTDLFDCTDRIAAYYNPAIEQFHGIHQGKRCFIVATGPSLRMEDLDLLKKKGELCISMNSIYHAFPETDWRPDYYMAYDYRVLDAIKGIIDEWSLKAGFISNDSDAFWQVTHKENIYCYHQTYDYCFDRFPKFSDDLSRRAYPSATIAYVCIQFAAYMGFREIYLFGVDFTNGSQKKDMSHPHFYEEGKVRKEHGKDYYNVSHTGKSFNGYVTALKYADLHGMKIYNATRGGELEIFERVDFDTLFA